MDYNLTELKFEDQSSNDSESSSVIWVILFTLLMILSVLSNAIYIVSLATRKVTTTRIIISCFFVINLLDYSLIIFEFSLGPDNQFSYTDMSCALYQLLLQLSPMLSSAALLLLLLPPLSFLCTVMHCSYIAQCTMQCNAITVMY